MTTPLQYGEREGDESSRTADSHDGYTSSFSTGIMNPGPYQRERQPAIRDRAYDNEAEPET